MTEPKSKRCDSSAVASDHGVKEPPNVSYSNSRETAFFGLASNSFWRRLAAAAALSGFACGLFRPAAGAAAAFFGFASDLFRAAVVAAEAFFGFTSVFFRRAVIVAAPFSGASDSRMIAQKISHFETFRAFMS